MTTYLTFIVPTDLVGFAYSNSFLNKTMRSRNGNSSFIS